MMRFFKIQWQKWRQHWYDATITRKLNRMYREEDSQLDPDMMRLQELSIIDGEEW